LFLFTLLVFEFTEFNKLYDCFGGRLGDLNHIDPAFFGNLTCLD